jgi:hypothetical protein
MVKWWWIPASFGIVFAGATVGFLLVNIGSVARYIKISTM